MTQNQNSSLPTKRSALENKWWFLISMTVIQTLFVLALLQDAPLATRVAFSAVLVGSAIWEMRRLRND